MMMKHRVVQLVLVLLVLVMSAAHTPPRAAAAELGDYLWKRRPLLLFAPMENDPRLVETLDLIEASRCDFIDRDMVLGVVVADGKSTLDGQVMDVNESKRLAKQYAVGADAFAVVLIGKDGGEKWRSNAVPDLQTIYDAIDGMPMRSSEMNSGRRQC